MLTAIVPYQFNLRSDPLTMVPMLGRVKAGSFQQNDFDLSTHFMVAPQGCICSKVRGFVLCLGLKTKEVGEMK
jgi:hypothetical protein